MTTRWKSEQGDTLLEIVVAMVLIGIVVAAALATFTTQGSGSTTQRSVVTADTVLRRYAETTKAAARAQCASGTTYTVTFTPPSGYSVNPLVNQACPPAATTSTASQPWPPVTLTVTLPNSQTRSLTLVVRSS